MAEHHQRPSYMWIWVWLAVLTAAELYIAVSVSEQLPKVVLLVGLALSKAILVALYFMHLRFERTTLMVIAATPLIICTFLVFMLMPDQGAFKRTSEIRAEQAESEH